MGLLTKGAGRRFLGGFLQYYLKDREETQKRERDRSAFDALLQGTVTQGPDSLMGPQRSGGLLTDPNEIRQMGLLHDYSPQLATQMLAARLNQPKEPSLIAEYTAAVNRGMFSGTLTEYVDMKKAGVNVTNIIGGESRDPNLMDLHDINPEVPPGTIANVDDKGKTTIVSKPRQQTAAEKQSASERTIALEALDRIEALSSEIDTTDWKIQGNIGGGSLWQRGLAFVTPGDLSKKEADFVADLKQFQKQYIAAVRGANVGPEEEKSMLEALPELGQDKNLFASNIKISRQNLQRLEQLQAMPGPATTTPLAPVKPLSPGTPIPPPPPGTVPVP